MTADRDALREVLDVTDTDAALWALLSNRQMRDDAVLSVTTGELRRLAAAPPPLDVAAIRHDIVQASIYFGNGDGVKAQEFLTAALARLAAETTP